MNEIALNKMELTLENRIETIEEGMRKNYLSRLSDMAIVPSADLEPLEDDLIDNVRLYHVSEMVYQKGENVVDKFTTVLNTLSTYKSSVFIILDSNGYKTDFYIGVRNNEDSELKRSTVTLGDTLKQTLIGHFPGIKIDTKDRFEISKLCHKIENQKNMTSVSIVGDMKSPKESDENFTQGLEKLMLAMQGRQYIGIIIAESRMPEEIQRLRNDYQELYTKLSPYQKIQFNTSDSKGVSKSLSFSEMNGKQKASMLGATALSLGGVIGGMLLGSGKTFDLSKAVSGSMIGGQVTGH